MINISSLIGLSALKITPEETNIPLGGYLVRYSTGVHDDIYVRTLYLAADQEVFIIACDLLGLYGTFVQRIRKRINHQTGVNEQNILICALHDHSAPDTIGLEGIKGFFKYTLRAHWYRKIEAKIVQSAIAAKKNAKAGKIGVSSRILDVSEKIVINRRHPRRPLNYPLSVFKLTNDAESIGSIINYACHGTTLNRDNRLISAEYPGYLIKAIENKFGPNHRAMYINGPCGDINPYLFPEEWDFEKIDFDFYLKGDFGNFNALCNYSHTKRIGELLAYHAISLLNEIEPEKITTLKILTKEIRIPVIFDSPHMKFFDLLQIALIKKGLFKLLKAYNRSNISYFSYIQKNGQMYVGTELQFIKINEDILIIAIPAEIFSEIGEELLAKSPIKNTILVCLANDWIGYIFPLNECQYGGYEVFGLPNLAGILAGTVIKNTIIKMFSTI
ncbi:MAG: neutral/alkaline non-lysosomal ceramidase N-terminal domain-containing protein [Candidatus Helarchaeota archaeon]